MRNKFITLLALVLVLVAPGRAAAASLHMAERDYTITVTGNDIDVVEEWQLPAGTSGMAYRTIPDCEPFTISGWAVTLPDGTPVAATAIPHGVQWQTASDTYLVRYHVANAISVSGGVRTLNWTIVDRMRFYDVDHAVVAVHLPAGAAVITQQTYIRTTGEAAYGGITSNGTLVSAQGGPFPGQGDVFMCGFPYSSSWRIYVQWGYPS